MSIHPPLWQALSPPTHGVNIPPELVAKNQHIRQSCVANEINARANSEANRIIYPGTFESKVPFLCFTLLQLPSTTSLYTDFCVMLQPILANTHSSASAMRQLRLAEENKKTT